MPWKFVCLCQKCFFLHENFNFNGAFQHLNFIVSRLEHTTLLPFFIHVYIDLKNRTPLLDNTVLRGPVRDVRHSSTFLLHTNTALLLDV